MSEENKQQLDWDLVNFAQNLADEYINNPPSLDEIDSFMDEINRPEPIDEYYQRNKVDKKPEEAQIRWPKEDEQYTELDKNALRATKKAWYKQHVIVPKEIQKSRLKECEGCYHYQKGMKRCMQCGCFLVPKTALSMSFCPLQKWGQWDRDDTEVSE